MTKMNESYKFRVRFLKAIALSTAIVFLSTSSSFGLDILNSPAATSHDTSKASINLLNENLPLSEWHIPDTIGTIKNRYQGSRNETVIILQDAHVNEDAQRSIADILKFFAENHDLNLINLEGAEGELYTRLFSFISNRNAKKTVADYFLREARLTGPEYLSILDRPELKLYGVENRELYEKNRQAYLDALDFKSRDEAILNQLGTLLETLSRFVFQEDLRELYRRRRGLHDEGRELVSYVQFLISKAHELEISMDSYQGMKSLDEVTQLERQIHFDKAEEEVGVLVRDLKRHVAPNRLTRLVTTATQYQMKKMPRVDFYAFLEAEIKRVPTSSGNEDDFQTKYENVIRYLRYIQLFDALRSSLFDEIESVEALVKSKLLRGPREEQLDRLLKVHEIFQKLFDFALTKQDANYFYEHKAEFVSDTFLNALPPLLNEYKFSLGLPAGLTHLDEDLPKIETFYSSALERDQMLIERAVKKMQSEKQEISAIVAGGFHTPGIESYLKENGYSYIVVMPHISSKIDEVKESALYEDALRQNPLGLEKILTQTFFPQTQQTLNDPRFQLAAWHLVPNKPETLEQLQSLGIVRANQDILGFISENPSRALGVFMAVLMATKNVFYEKNLDSAIASWRKVIESRNDISDAEIPAFNHLFSLFEEAEFSQVDQKDYLFIPIGNGLNIAIVAYDPRSSGVSEIQRVFRHGNNASSVLRISSDKEIAIAILDDREVRDAIPYRRPSSTTISPTTLPKTTIAASEVRSPGPKYLRADAEEYGGYKNFLFLDKDTNDLSSKDLEALGLGEHDPLEYVDAFLKKEFELVDSEKGGLFKALEDAGVRNTDKIITRFARGKVKTKGKGMVDSLIIKVTAQTSSGFKNFVYRISAPPEERETPVIIADIYTDEENLLDQAIRRKGAKNVLGDFGQYAHVTAKKLSETSVKPTAKAEGIEKDFSEFIIKVFGLSYRNKDNEPQRRLFAIRLGVRESIVKFLNSLSSIFKRDESTHAQVAKITKKVRGAVKPKAKTKPRPDGTGSVPIGEEWNEGDIAEFLADLGAGEVDTPPIVDVNDVDSMPSDFDVRAFDGTTTKRDVAAPPKSGAETPKRFLDDLNNQVPVDIPGSLELSAATLHIILNRLESASATFSRKDVQTVLDAVEGKKEAIEKALMNGTGLGEAAIARIVAHIDGKVDRSGKKLSYGITDRLRELRRQKGLIDGKGNRVNIENAPVKVPAKESGDESSIPLGDDDEVPDFTKPSNATPQAPSTLGDTQTFDEVSTPRPGQGENIPPTVIMPTPVPQDQKQVDAEPLVRTAKPVSVSGAGDDVRLVETDGVKPAGLVTPISFDDFAEPAISPPEAPDKKQVEAEPLVPTAKPESVPGTGDDVRLVGTDGVGQPRPISFDDSSGLGAKAPEVTLVEPPVSAGRSRQQPPLSIDIADMLRHVPDATSEETSTARPDQIAPSAPAPIPTRFDYDGLLEKLELQRARLKPEAMQKRVTDRARELVSAATGLPKGQVKLSTRSETRTETDIFAALNEKLGVLLAGLEDLSSRAKADNARYAEVIAQAVQKEVDLLLGEILEESIAYKTALLTIERMNLSVREKNTAYINLSDSAKKDFGLFQARITKLASKFAQLENINLSYSRNRDAVFNELFEPAVSENVRSQYWQDYRTILFENAEAIRLAALPGLERATMEVSALLAELNALIVPPLLVSEPTAAGEARSEIRLATQQERLATAIDALDGIREDLFLRRLLAIADAEGIDLENALTGSVSRLAQLQPQVSIPVTASRAGGVVYNFDSTKPGEFSFAFRAINSALNRLPENVKAPHIFVFRDRDTDTINSQWNRLTRAFITDSRVLFVDPKAPTARAEGLETLESVILRASNRTGIERAEFMQVIANVQPTRDAERRLVHRAQLEAVALSEHTVVILGTTDRYVMDDSKTIFIRALLTAILHEKKVAVSA